MKRIINFGSNTMMKTLKPILFFVTLGLLFNGAVGSYARQGAELKQPSAPALGWQGVYTFGEVGGKNTGMVIDYSIKVCQQNGRLVADLDGDGFQTQTRLFCEVKATDNKIQLFFKSYRKDNLFEIYKPGELLLSLEARKGKLLTYWGALKPQLIAFKNGRVYFTKQRRSGRPGR